MSFTLTKTKRSGEYPIAKVRGGADDGKYLYLNKHRASLSDIPKTKLDKLDLSETDKAELNDALKSGLEPDDENLTKIFYNFLDYIKEKNCKFTLRTGGKLEPLPNPKVVEKVLISGISGSGKSTFAAQYIRNYLKQHRGNNFFIISSVDEDEVLDRLEPERLDYNEIAQDGIDMSELEDSLVLYDDIGTIQPKSVRKVIEGTRDHLLETGRHSRTSVINVSHLITNHHESRRILNEAQSVVLFPKSNARAIKKYLVEYQNFDKDLISRCLNLKSRWFMIKGTPSGVHVPIIISEKSAFCI
jgi:adenylate kinase family enzyme